MRTYYPGLRWIAVVMGALLPAFAMADDFALPTLSSSDYDNLVKEFSANSQYTTTTPASSLGGLWGFEFGVVGGITKAPDTLSIVQRNNPTTGLKDKLPHAGGLVRLGLPLGFTGEALYLPKIKAASVKISRWGIAAMWTANDTVLQEFPITVAAKGYVTKTSLEYSQNVTVSGIPVASTISLDDTLYGVQAIASYKFLGLLEPWVGIGYTKAKGVLNLDVNASTAGTILDGTTFGAGATSATSKQNSAQLMAGLELKLLFLCIGAEAERAFGRNSYTGRVSFRF